MAKVFVLKPQEIKKDLEVDYAKELNKEQYQVATTAEGPCLVLAGAGSGKTRTIVFRVAYLIERGVSPENILLVTFTNKAAKEMLSRVAKLLGKHPEKLWGGTFHHIGNRILRKYAKLLGYQSNFTILDEEDSKGLLNICLQEMNIDVKQRRFPSAAVLKDLISFSKNANQKLIEVLEIKHPHWLELEDKIRGIARLYERKKKTNNAMDFDDLLVNWLKLLKENPTVKERLATQFQYILVDEYQDTNYLQAKIIRELSYIHHNVLVVGDDAQSIYSFRAADIDNILNFPKTFPQTRIFKLETNYRSTPQILNVANEVIKYNVRQYPKLLQPQVNSFVKPNLVSSISPSQEAEFVSQMILQLRDEGVPLDKMAVLFRATFHSQELEFALTQKDIPYEYRGGLRFFERAHIKDAIAYLRVINNPKDEVAWLRILNQQQGIGNQTAVRIFQRLKNINCIVKCFDQDFSDILTSRSKVGWDSLVNIFLKDLKIRTLKDLADSAGLINDLIKSDYQNYLEAVYSNWQERLQDLEQLARFSESYKDVNSFLSEITLQEVFAVERANPNNQEKERLVLSTIHQAKGLEWEVVFIINLVDSAFPHTKALAEENGLEEERRLFYVAITRAKKQLFFSYPLTDSYVGRYLNIPSSFLQEIPEELMEEVKLVENGINGFNHLNDGDIQYLPEV
ncbi:ATP-dependent helicase [Patescibacteria group bacterium]|nr:ATP-dependent helicase [Patescibacteria group bacterium]